MLEQLLAEIRSGGTLEVNDLAKKLGVSPQLVVVMLDHLQRSGYLRPYETCGEGCGGCSLKIRSAATPDGWICSRCGRGLIEYWQNHPHHFGYYQCTDSPAKTHRTRRSRRNTKEMLLFNQPSYFVF